MSRVYLFADFGKGPLVAWSSKWNPLDWNERDVERAILKRFPDAPCDSFGRLTAPWWLVECANAEAGRAIIGAALFAASLGEGASPLPREDGGRILASGGAA